MLVAVDNELWLEFKTEEGDELHLPVASIRRLRGNATRTSVWICDAMVAREACEVVVAEGIGEIRRRMAEAMAHHRAKLEREVMQGMGRSHLRPMPPNVG